MIFDVILIVVAIVLVFQGWKMFHVEQFWAVVMIVLGTLVFIGTAARHYDLANRAEVGVGNPVPPKEPVRR